MKIKLLASMLITASLLFAACQSSTTEAPATDVPVAEVEHADEDEHMDEHADEEEHTEDEIAHSPDDHMDGGHDVPEEASAVLNPIEASDESVGTGADLYAANCSVCHGETGEGDGPGGASLDPEPADLHEDHVQGLTDGGLFYVISHSKPESPMPAWENVLTEAQRWHVVNFLRTFADQ